MVDADREVGDNHEDYSSGDKVAADIEFPEAGEKRKRQNSSGDDNSSDDQNDDLEDDNGDGDNSENDDVSDEENGDDCDCPEEGKEKKRSILEITDDELLENFTAGDIDDMDEDYKQKLIHKIFPTLRKYLHQVRLSKGFDIEDWPGPIFGLTPIAPLEICQRLGSSFVESTEVYQNLSKLALEHYNQENGTAYMDAKFVKVNLATSCYLAYYLTFTAVDPYTSNAGASEPTRRTFQSHITRYMIGKDHKPKIVLCRLKPNQC